MNRTHEVHEQSPLVDSRRSLQTLAGRPFAAAAHVGTLVAALVFTAWRSEPDGQDSAVAGFSPFSRPTDFHQLPAVRVTLRDAAGRLAAILFNEHPLRDAAELRRKIEGFCGSAAGATVEADLDCDGNLRYGDTRANDCRHFQLPCRGRADARTAGRSRQVRVRPAGKHE